MAIRVTFATGHENFYDDQVIWELEQGVLKIGSQRGKWDNIISPSAWHYIDTNAVFDPDRDTVPDAEDADADPEAEDAEE
jgi:hypothetical protein